MAARGEVEVEGARPMGSGLRCCRTALRACWLLRWRSKLRLDAVSMNCFCWYFARIHSSLSSLLIDC